MTAFGILQDMASGRVVVGGTFTPTRNEMIEVAVEAIEEAYFELIPIQDDTWRKRGGIQLIKLMDEIAGLLPGSRARIPFGPDGTAWVETVKMKLGIEIFGITPEMLARLDHLSLSPTIGWTISDRNRP